MRKAVQKSLIPSNRVFLIRELHDKHFDPVWHFHSDYQLFWVIEGSGTRFIGDSVRHFEKGELVFTGPDLPHLWRSDDVFFDKKSEARSRGLVIYLRENFLGKDIHDKDEMKSLIRLFEKSKRGLEFSGQTKSLVIKKMRELQNLQGTASLLQLLGILDILAQSKEVKYISPASYTNPFKEVEADRMSKVYAYVLDNFKQEIRLNDISALLHMTPTSFSRYFTMKTNKPFSRFVSELRVRHASKLLMQEDQSIAAISYECGFKTLSNFNKQFRDVLQQTPSEYRKKFMEIREVSLSG